MGCRHDRESSYTGQSDYSHGLRYCDGIAP